MMKRFALPSLPAFLVVLGLAAAPPQAAAQGLGMMSQDDGVPIEIYADQGIEWEQDAKRMIARGNARAERGNVVVRADVLMAYYRDREGMGGTDISRLEAVGNVRISSPTETAYGDNAVYQVDDAVLVMKGDGLKLVTESAVITARDSLEYWENRRQAVARGKARAEKDGQTIAADLLTATFEQDAKGKFGVKKVIAIDNVEVKTTKERATADKGDYDIKSGMATLEGDVRIHSQGSTVTGAYATVNLNSGKSKLFAAKPGSGGGSDGSAGGGGQKRVKVLLVPKKKSGDQPAAGGQ